MEWRIQTDMSILKLVWGQHWFSFITLMVDFDLGHNSDSFGELRWDKMTALPWWERSWRGSPVMATYHSVFMRSVVDLWRARRSWLHKRFTWLRHHYHHNHHSKQPTNTFISSVQSNANENLIGTADCPDALWVRFKTPYTLPWCEVSTVAFHPDEPVCKLASCSETANEKSTA